MLSNSALRDGFIAAVEGLDLDMFVTLAFNRAVLPRAGEAAVMEFLRRLERQGHGKRWVSYPPQARLRGYGFPEHLNRNAHYHLALQCTDRLANAAMNYGQDIWRKLVVTGHADIQAAESRQAVARYITKYTAGEWSLENYIAYGPTSS